MVCDNDISGKIINLDTLDQLMCCLMTDFQKNKDDIRELIARVAPDLKKDIWKTVLYADCMSGNVEARNHRFSLFVMMYEASEVLQSDDSFAYDAFMEAYQRGQGGQVSVSRRREGTSRAA